MAKKDHTVHVTTDDGKTTTVRVTAADAREYEDLPFAFPRKPPPERVSAMGKAAVTMFHIQAKRSWWSGRVTALCGWVADAGDYEVKGWFSSVKTCPTCKALDGQQR